jgi:hypothetical protein
MKASSEDIKDMLVAESSLGLIFNENLFTGRIVLKPKEVVVILDSYGFPSKLALSNQGYEYPAVQILLRGVDYNDTMVLAMNIKDILHGRNHETWNEALYTVIACSSGPTLLEWDANGLCNISINFNLQRRAV